MNLKIKQGQLDTEWVKLIKYAKELGLTVEEVRLFLTESKGNSAS